MAWPVPSQYRITTAYGARGNMWSCNKNAAGGLHTGVDMLAPRGTPIYATIAGQIRHRDYGVKFFGPYQFAISPDTDQPFGRGEVFYAHCLSRLPDGTRVVPGQRISEVGDLGNASGPHLHYEYHPAAKNVWNCTVHANPQPTLDWAPTSPVGPTPTPPTKDWMFPAGKKVYAKYLKWDGHELNSDKVSDSIKCWQEMLNKHTLVGGTTLPITGKFWTQTAEETQKCQAQHMPPKDDPLTAVYVGPRQWGHIKADTGAPYDFVLDDTAESPPGNPGVPPAAADRPGSPAMLCPGAIWDPIPKSNGGWFTGLRPFTGVARKITLHTTETSAKPNWAAQQSGIPHLTCDLVHGVMWQHLPFDMAAYTLKGGDHSPNADSGLNIQIEIIGYTSQCATWPLPDYDNLRILLTWLSKTLAIPYVIPYNFGAPLRLTWDQWEQTKGILGHCHAPYNDHSDPTGLNTALLMIGAPVEPQPEPPIIIPEPPQQPETDYVTKAEWNQLRDEVATLLQRMVDVIEP
jgi:peptidase M23-like protein